MLGTSLGVLILKYLNRMSFGWFYLHGSRRAGYHLKFCVVCIIGRRYVCCSECNSVSNECNESTPCLVQPIGTHGSEVMFMLTYNMMIFLSRLLLCLCACVVPVAMWSSLVCL